VSLGPVAMELFLQVGSCKAIGPSAVFATNRVGLHDRAC